MRSKVYRQTSSKWRNIYYPTKSSRFGGNGCGCCSVLHVIMEREKYKKATPKTIVEYMRQYAGPGRGALWGGIKAALVHYGVQHVRWYTQSDSMTSVFTELNKGGRLGVILFGSTPGPDGTIWTRGGHYIAFTGYKRKGGRHYFYLKDSGDRRHVGWYCYEKSMRGDVKQVWTCTLPKAEKEK